MTITGIIMIIMIDLINKFEIYALLDHKMIG